MPRLWLPELCRGFVACRRTDEANGPKGKETYAIKVENNSPLILNGIAVTGSVTKPNEPPKMLLGIALSPRRSLAVPASAEAVESFGLKGGIKVLALDLSGL